jgi:hypothetical protein
LLAYDSEDDEDEPVGDVDEHEEEQDDEQDNEQDNEEEEEEEELDSAERREIARSNQYDNVSRHLIG